MKKLILILVITIATSSCFGKIFNGHFDLFTDCNGTKPTGWDCFEMPISMPYSHVNVVTQRIFWTPYGDSQMPGSSIAWKIDPCVPFYPPSPYSRYLVLDNEAGNYGAFADQIIDIKGGQEISGYYFFGTKDLYFPGINENDYARLIFSPIPEDGRFDKIVVYIDVHKVGRYSSTDGWVKFRYIFHQCEAGKYRMRAELRDTGAIGSANYFALCGLTVYDYNTSVDLNGDGICNLQDYAVIAKNWRSEINLDGVDLNGDWVIDYKDIMIFADSYLNCKIEDEAENFVDFSVLANQKCNWKDIAKFKTLWLK
jgi:hypothetical protein